MDSYQDPVHCGLCSLSPIHPVGQCNNLQSFLTPLFQPHSTSNPSVSHVSTPFKTHQTHYFSPLLFFSHLSHHHFSPELKFSHQLISKDQTESDASLLNIFQGCFTSPTMKAEVLTKKNGTWNIDTSLLFTLSQLHCTFYCSSKYKQVLISKCSPFLLPLP